MYPCCSFKVLKCATKPLLLGNIHTEDLISILEKAENDLIIQALKENGPVHLLELVNDKNIPLPENIDSVYPCDLCSDIMSNSDYCQIIAQYLSANTNLREMY